MQIWAGLGNPGASYSLHRHNVGFMAADVIAAAHGLSAPKKAFRSELREGRIGKHRILLLKPQVFMNRSGDGPARICAPRDQQIAFRQHPRRPGPRPTSQPSSFPKNARGGAGKARNRAGRSYSGCNLSAISLMKRASSPSASHSASAAIAASRSDKGSISDLA